MGNLAKTMNMVAVLVTLTATASCGSPGDSTGFGSGSGGSSSSGAGSGGSSGGSVGSSDGGSSSGSGSGGLVVYAADAGAPATACNTPGSTRSCCGTGTSAAAGTETCASSGEFATWGPCLGPTGATISCVPVHVCGPNENGAGCDAGVDARPPPPPPPPALCTDPTVSTEPEILVGYEPAAGQTVGKNGQIKVWVADENPPFIAPNEQVNNTTGAITTPGDRAAVAADGLLYEPALYIAPQTPTNGGTPHFPQWVKGSYNNNPPTRGTFTGGAPIDTAPPVTGLGALFGLGGAYTGEFIWDVSSLGLAPGSYTAVFSVHDGDRDRAIACVTIVIAP